MLLLTKIHVLLVFLWSAEAKQLMDSGIRKEILISDEAKADLMELDQVLIHNLKEYLNRLEEKITKLQILVGEIRQPLEAAKGVEEEYLSNPLHSFPLIRHMYQDWKYLEEFMRRPVGQEQIHFLKGKLPELPLKVDSDEATEAMYRMARTYDATPWEMAHGLIDGIQFRGTLSALDCFEIGKLYFKWGYFEEASQWFNNSRIFGADSEASEALGLYKNEVALLLARSLVEIDQTDEAHKVLVEQPDLAENESSLLALFKAHKHNATPDAPRLAEEYALLCRSSHVSSPSRLHCRYNTTTSPFLILAPLKMEEISLDPYIIVYHDVLSVERTEEIIRIGSQMLEPTTVFYKEQSQVRNTDRTALGAWLSPEDMHSSGLPLHNVIRDITGLKIDDTTEYQLLKYGFGAHYAPHPDFFNDTMVGMESVGDRIATVLFYLNDVPHGGDTVFTKLNISVSPERGKVLFWYNLKGETHDLDLATIHAACPVFTGTKFAMSVWIGELSQMFIQPAYREGSRHYFF